MDDNVQVIFFTRAYEEDESVRCWPSWAEFGPTKNRKEEKLDNGLLYAREGKKKREGGWGGLTAGLRSSWLEAGSISVFLNRTFSFLKIAIAFKI